MRTAAALLSAATTDDGLDAIARASGLCPERTLLDPATRVGLGLADLGGAALGSGPGHVRVLFVVLPPGHTLREHIHAVLRRVAARAPHVLWFVAARDALGHEAGLFSLAAESGPRVASFVWQPAHVVDSDAETLCALAAVPRADDTLFHARAAEILGRDALTRRFYRALEQRITALQATAPPRVAPEDARAASLLLASRLLFLRFLEAKGWLDGDRGFLSRQFDECLRDGGRFHQRVLLPLFFGTLNTPLARRAPRARALGRIPFLNGGLFSPTALERRLTGWRVPDDSLGALFTQVFARFRFVAREDSATWSEAAVDPEMLGRAFESLMAAGERKAGGVYYTPHALVARVAEQALDVAGATTLHAVRDLRILDPACGSGAFLVYLLERLADRRIELGDAGSRASVRRDVLAGSIFGVDRNPTAVWLCELRLWLSVVIESGEADPMRVPPLPNLDRNVRVGDALAGQAFAVGPAAIVGSARLERLRGAYVRATGKRKRHLERQLDREERTRVLAQIDREIVAVQHARRERLAAQRGRDLFGNRAPRSTDARRGLLALRQRLRELRANRRRVADGGALSFSFHASFASAQARGGFDVVVGNPPWVRLHHIPAAVRARFREQFAVFRRASWQPGATAAGISAGFASQVDLAALFVERSLQLLRRDGVLALLVPSKLWRSLAGGGLRELLLRDASLERLEEFADGDHAFDAAVYPSLIVARAGAPQSPQARLALHHADCLREWQAATHAVAFDGTPGAPWLLLSPDARAAFDRVRTQGTALSATAFGSPRLGVKSGCNAAFVVQVLDANRGLGTVRDGNGDTGAIELAMLRPALRGDSVTPWTREGTRESIIWTHGDDGAPLAELPARTRLWLQRHYGTLTARSDAARARRWWSLFRVDAADCSRHRVVWADFGRRPRALVLPPGDPAVPLNSCYVVPCARECDAQALAVLLNSPLMAAWLNAIAEPARGGYRRYLGWTVGLMPLPRDWSAVSAGLAAAMGADDDAVLAATLRAFNLRHPQVSALLTWSGFA